MLSARLLILQELMHTFISYERQEEWIVSYIESILKYKTVDVTDQNTLDFYASGLFLKDFITFLFSKYLIKLYSWEESHPKRMRLLL